LLGSETDITIAGSAESVQVAVEQIKFEARYRPVGLAGEFGGQRRKAFQAIQDAKLGTRVIMLVESDSKDDFVEAVRQGCCRDGAKQTSTNCS
jgi:hypothetical protein